MDQPLTPATFRALLGEFPAAVPLAVTTLAEQVGSGYTRRLIEYAVDGEERVRAYLLLPHHPGGQPLPGILAIHQDGNNRPYQFGKSEPAGVAGDPDLAYGLELCLRGYVVICPDRFPSRAAAWPPRPSRLPSIVSASSARAAWN